uniref:Uncharacterized protein n=1 Tax=Mycena chlorophos TaxID=658473 RepID=A0ABQ0LAF9_MYCCL|nr:predicted protein [Mycena chlorophos]
MRNDLARPSPFEDRTVGGERVSRRSAERMNRNAPSRLRRRLLEGETLSHEEKRRYGDDVDPSLSTTTIHLHPSCVDQWRLAVRRAPSRQLLVGTYRAIRGFLRRKRSLAGDDDDQDDVGTNAIGLVVHTRDPQPHPHPNAPLNHTTSLIPHPVSSQSPRPHLVHRPLRSSAFFQMRAGLGRVREGSAYRPQAFSSRAGWGRAVSYCQTHAIAFHGRHLLVATDEVDVEGMKTDDVVPKRRRCRRATDRSSSNAMVHDAPSVSSPITATVVVFDLGSRRWPMHWRFPLSPLHRVHPPAAEGTAFGCMSRECWLGSTIRPQISPSSYQYTLQPRTSSSSSEISLPSLDGSSSVSKLESVRFWTCTSSQRGHGIRRRTASFSANLHNCTGRRRHASNQPEMTQTFTMPSIRPHPSSSASIKRIPQSSKAYRPPASASAFR